MISRSVIDEFLSHKSVALVGVSRNGKGFGHTIRKELVAKGYTVHLVHHEVDAVAGQPCSRTLAALASQVTGVIMVTPPARTEQLVREAKDAGIGRVWLQQGAETEQAIRFCAEHGLSVVHGQCILMFAEPTGFPHGLHRWLRRSFGGKPS
jgi:hypothetical protein